MDLSKTAEDLLASERFTPCSEGFLAPTFLADQLDCTVKEAESYLAELEQAAFLQRMDPRRFADPKEPYFQTTVQGWFASEKLLRQRRLRRQALLDQRNYQLEDLILALAFEPHAINDRLKGGMLARASQVPLLSIFVRLGEWAQEDIQASVIALVNARLLEYKKRRVRGEDCDAIELTIRGRRKYLEETRPKLHLAEDEYILDPPPPTLKVFFAWQSECKPARNVLFAVVPEVIAAINGRTDLLRPIELVQATEPGEGALRIDVALEDKIRAADYFIGDLSPVYIYKGRLRVNENVLVEVGFALASKPPERIVLLAMQDVAIDGDGSQNPQPAFDIGHVRRLQFKVKNDVTGKLRGELEAMLRNDGWFAGSPQGKS